MSQYAFECILFCGKMLNVSYEFYIVCYQENVTTCTFKKGVGTVVAFIPVAFFEVSEVFFLFALGGEMSV